MVQKNYWKWLNSILDTNVYGDNIYSKNIGLVATDGSDCEIALRSNNTGDITAYIAYNHMLNYGVNVLIGTGESEISADDYVVDGDITSSISNLSFTYTSTGNENIGRIITITGTNSTGNPVNITRVGLTKSIQYLNPSWASKNVMMAECLLESPLTVLNGDNFSLTFEWVEG